MDKTTKSNIGKALFGAGGTTALLAFLFCGMPWVLAGLFATLGLSFLLQDSFLIPILILGIIIAFIGWKMLRK